MYRVILDDGRKLVGVRVPTAALPSLRHHLAEALQIRKAIVSAGGGGTVEDITPLDTKLLVKAKTAPKTMLSFFGLTPSSGSSSQSPPPRSNAGEGVTVVSVGLVGKKREVHSVTHGFVSCSSGGHRKRGKGMGTGKAVNEDLRSVANGVAALFGGKAMGGDVSKPGSATAQKTEKIDAGSSEVEVIDVDSD